MLPPALQVLRGLLDRYGGHEVRTDGDSFTIAFHDAVDAINWCCKVKGAPLNARQRSISCGWRSCHTYVSSQSSRCQQPVQRSSEVVTGTAGMWCPLHTSDGRAACCCPAGSGGASGGQVAAPPADPHLRPGNHSGRLLQPTAVWAGAADDGGAASAHGHQHRCAWGRRHGGRGAGQWRWQWWQLLFACLAVQIVRAERALTVRQLLHGLPLDRPLPGNCVSPCCC